MKTVVLLITLVCAPSLVLAASTLVLKTHDGVELDARYYSAGKPGPGLLFLNMCDPSRDQLAWENVANSLSAHGYHVLTFDYRGFGKSGGSRPVHLTSIEVAMPFWREHWMSDVQVAYDTLVAQEGVQSLDMGIAGASCGVFMGLEFTLEHSNIRSLAFLGGPTQQQQLDKLAERTDLPVLLMTGNEGPAFDWTDGQYAAAKHPDSRMHKYSAITHGTNLFEYEPSTQQLVVDWFRKTINLQPGAAQGKLDDDQQAAQAAVSAYHQALISGDGRAARKAISEEFTMFNGNFSGDPALWQAHNYMSGVALDAWPKDFVKFAGPYKNDYEFISTHARGDAAIVVTTETGSNKFRAWKDETVTYWLGRQDGEWKITSLFIRDIKNPE